MVSKVNLVAVQYYDQASNLSINKDAAARWAVYSVCLLNINPCIQSLKAKVKRNSSGQKGIINIKTLCDNLCNNKYFISIQIIHGSMTLCAGCELEKKKKIECFPSRS